MEDYLIPMAITVTFLPLIGALIAGLLGKVIGREQAAWLTIALLSVSFVLALYLFAKIVIQGHPAVNGALYTWMHTGVFQFDVGFLLDRLSATMIVIVTFVSLMVHIYTIGYMADDAGYQRFFSYMSLFTFAMLTLVLANNFLLMFFGWEGVGLVSYLLIGFWFSRESAVFGSLKAFIVNRVGDLGFILAIAAILMYFDHLDYQYVFSHVAEVIDKTIKVIPHHPSPVITVICFLLFIGAMGKSAQVPLHVWLPESMEGPTPISALIHAATMVTAGIYMVARLSPLFEFAPAALTLILVLGATTCLFMGILAVFQQDIKRVIAYSTLSQLGYMVVALGASAYDAAIFHLLTHAFFKALLFLAAGSVIVALHHEQDMRKMGGLAPYMPITYFTFFIGALALSAIPPFSGFYSKDVIIEAVHLSTLPGAGYAYACVLIGAFLTPLYIFRALFLTFHGKMHVEKSLKDHVQESPWVILAPLLALSVPSIIIGGILVSPMIFNEPRLLGNSIFVLPQHDTILRLTAETATYMALSASKHLTFWLAVAGIFAAYLFNIRFKEKAERIKERFAFAYRVIQKKYGFDDFNQIVLVRGTRRLGSFFYQITDLKLIDGVFVNGSGKLIRWFSQKTSHLQTGYIYHYSLAMIAGLFIFLGWIMFGVWY